jgi:hypothetical protein
MQRKIAANAIIARTTRDSETEALKAENERLKAEKENTQLRTEANEAATGSQSLTEILLKQLQETNDKVMALQTEMSKAQLQAVQERLAAFQEELHALSAKAQEPSGSLIDVVKSELADAKELVEMVTPTALALPAGTETAQFQAYKMKHEAEQLRASWARDDAKTESTDRLAMEHGFREREVRLQEQHYETASRFYEHAAPQIVSILGRFAEAFFGRNGTGAAAAPDANGQAQNTPAGALSMACGQCQTVILYKDEFAGVFCPTCGAEYSITPEQQESAPAEAVVVDE